MNPSNSNTNQIATVVIQSSNPYMILDFDPAFCGMTGYQTDELIKKPLTIDRLLHKDDFMDVVTSMRYQLSIANTLQISSRIVTKAGIILPVLINGEAFFLEDGSEVIQLKIGVGAISKEPSESPVSEEKHHNDLEVFANTVPSILSKHLLDNKLSLIWANNYFYTIYGYSVEEFKNKYGKSTLSLVYHEDLSTVINALADLSEYSSSKILNFRINCANGTTKWVNAIFARSGEYQDGFPVVNMVVSDITNLKIAEMKAALEEQKYLIISDISEELPFEYDIKEDTITFADKFRNFFAGESFVIKPEKTLVLNGMVAPESTESFAELCYLMSVGTEYHSTELLLNTKNGGYQWYVASFSTIYDEAEKPIRAVGLLRNIHAQKTRQLQLLAKSETDQMTGLFNKVTTENRIKENLRELNGNSYNVFMLIDIDNFKAINDTYGHLKGDDVIVDIARAILDESNGYGFGGRLGGDEFCMYLDNILDIQLAEEKAKLIENRLRRLYPGGDTCKVTLSIGIVATNEQITYDTLLDRADVALYNAKVAGKDQYCCYTDGMEHVHYENRREDASVAKTGKSGVADNHIISELMTTLYAGPNTYINIEKAINLLGNIYPIDRISIWEHGFNHSFLDCTHRWCKDKEEHAMPRSEHFPAELFRNIDAISQNGITYIANTESSNIPGSTDKLLQLGITSLLQSRIVMNGTVIGYIGFYNCTTDIVWDAQMIELFQIFFKAIAEAVCSKHRQQNLSLLRDDVVNAFNLVQTPMLVISNDTYDILYYNDATQDFFPHIGLNCKCYSTLYDEASPCSICPLRRLTEGKSISITRVVPSRKVSMDIHMTPITWNMNRSAFLVYVTMHEQSITEQLMAQMKPDILTEE